MRGAFSEQDDNDANSWDTCACSYYKELPRGMEDCPSAPKDPTLYRVGNEFAELVFENEFALAAWALCAIDARAKVVIQYAEVARLYPILALAQSQ